MSNNIPAVGDRVRFLANYPANGRFAKAGDIATVRAVRSSYLGDSPMLDFVEPISAAYAHRVEVVQPAAPVFAIGDEVRVEEATYRTGRGAHTHHHIGEYVGMVGKVVAEPDSDGDVDVEFSDGTTQPFDPAGLALHHAEPSPLVLAPGDRAVVESDIFTQPGGNTGQHSEFGDGDRPKVGDLVTIGAKCSETGDYEVGPWRISPEGLVPAPKFVPGDRVTIVASSYVGPRRKAGNTGTVVPKPEGFPGIRGISAPDYAVALDDEPTFRKVWGYRESELALIEAPVEPEAPALRFAKGDRVVLVATPYTSAERGIGTAGTVEHVRTADSVGGWDYRVSLDSGGTWGLDAEHLDAEPVAEAPTLSEGDRVKVTGPDFMRGNENIGAVGRITSGPDADGDYRVVVDGYGANYFAAASLALVVEEPAAEAYSIPHRFVAGVEAKPEDYALRLEVSAKAADILVRAGYSGVLGSDVAALGEFLLGIEKRQQ